MGSFNLTWYQAQSQHYIIQYFCIILLRYKSQGEEGFNRFLLLTGHWRLSAKTRKQVIQIIFLFGCFVILVSPSLSFLSSILSFSLLQRSCDKIGFRNLSKACCSARISIFVIKGLHYLGLRKYRTFERAFTENYLIIETVSLYKKTFHFWRLLTFLSEKYLVFLLFSFINKWVDQSARHSQQPALMVPICSIFSPIIIPIQAKKRGPGQNGVEKTCFKWVRQDFSQFLSSNLFLISQLTFLQLASGSQLLSSSN